MPNRIKPWTQQVWIIIAHYKVDRVDGRCGTTPCAPWPLSCWNFSTTKKKVRCRYNVVNFLQNSPKRHTIACPLGWDMVCRCRFNLWFIVLSPSLQWCMRYLVMLDHVITALKCIFFSFSILRLHFEVLLPEKQGSVCPALTIIAEGFGEQASVAMVLTSLVRNIPVFRGHCALNKMGPWCLKKAVNLLRPSDAYMHQWTNNHWSRQRLVV